MISFHSSSNIWVGRMILFSLILTICSGALLLSLPFACKTSISFFQALFTATSATCVTGLAIIPFTEFSWFGKIILLFLIQIGGLGLMTFSFFLTWNLIGGAGMAEQHMAREILNFERVGRMHNFLSTVIWMTVAIELFGAALMLPSFIQIFDFWPAIFYSLFYAVSAFCNAGITANPHGMAALSGQPLIPVIIAVLVTLGGIGFPVIYELLEMLRVKLGLTNKKILAPKLSLHSRLVLIFSFALIILGTLLVWLCEWPRLIEQKSTMRMIFEPIFYSINLRSSGFSLEAISNFSRATLFMSGLFMLIGSSPGGTGGGLKTTTFGVAIAGILATLHGKAQTTILGKAISNSQVHKTFAILSMGIVSLFSVIAILLYAHPQLNFFGLFFEAISAFSTTGFNLGLTTKLSTFGQVILMLAMIAGRIGSLTFIFAFRKPQIKTTYRLPEERVFIG